jgi:hypothetical protein
VSKPRRAAEPALAADPAATPEPPEPEPLPQAVAGVLALQRSAGNHATAQLLRTPKQVAVAGVTLSSARASTPPDGTVKATASPANATGVKWSVEKGTVEPAGTTIDAKGTVTVTAAQEAGDVSIKATSDDGSWAAMPLMISEKPAALDSTSGTDASTKERYLAEFVHTFTGKSGDKTKLEGANINEKFDSLTAESPFGTFTLEANRVGSHGWDLDGSGAMAGPDKVSIDKQGVDARKFVKSASNPAPGKTLPQDFTMTQKLHAKTWPKGALDAQAFTTTGHVRGLKDAKGSLQIVLSAGKDSVTIDYEGPPVYTNAAASPATVVASEPKPKAKGADWDRAEVQVSADVQPSTAKLVYSLVGDKLGCEIDKASGLVKIGDKAGTIKVRASDGTTGHYDEVAIQITPRPPATP